MKNLSILFAFVITAIFTTQRIHASHASKTLKRIASCPNLNRLSCSSLNGYRLLVEAPLDDSTQEDTVDTITPLNQQIKSQYRNYHETEGTLRTLQESYNYFTKFHPEKVKILEKTLMDIKRLQAEQEQKYALLLAATRKLYIKQTHIGCNKN